MTPEILAGLSPDERHQLYRMLGLKAVVDNRNLEVSGVLGTELVQSEFVHPETVLR